MRSKATLAPIIESADLGQVFVQNGHEKRGKWISPRIFQEADSSSGTVTLPGSNGHIIIVSIEDTRVAIVYDELALHIMESIDKLDANKADTVIKYTKTIIR